MLVVFEDAHWIDPSSADLLALAAERVSRRSALLIVTSRPGFSPSWENHAHSTVLVPNRLDSNQIATLADQISRKRCPPRSGADRRPSRQRAALRRGINQDRHGSTMQPNGPWLAKSCWPGRQPAVAICGRVLSSCTGHCRVARASTFPQLVAALPAARSRALW